MRLTVKQNWHDLTIAVVGATGVVGSEFLAIIAKRHPEVGNLKLLASHRSSGKKIDVNGKTFTVEETTSNSFNGVDLAFISVNTAMSRQLAPIAVSAGAVVIDDSSAFRMDHDVPLVVPEVNAEDLEAHKGIIAIPNCSTTPLAMVAHPLSQTGPIKRIIADTYQSVSGAGGSAMVELREQSLALLDGRTVEAKSQPQQIAFNVIPHIDAFQENGYTWEEQKMIDESRKILHSPDIAISATCVRVPVYISHSVSVHIELENPISVNEAKESLRVMPGLQVMDDPANNIYPMPRDVAGKDDVYVGRIRQDASNQNGLAMWVVSDNLRKGAALNSIQIAEEIIERDCLRI